MQARNQFPGPWPPTCIGSVLASPQLLDPQVSSAVGPLLFDRDGDTQRLVSAKWQNIEQSEAGISVSPTLMVQDNLDLDASAEILRLSESGNIVGNRLHGVQCPDGTTQIFFPFGHAQDRVGCTLMSTYGNKQQMRLSRDRDHASGLPSEEVAVSRSLCQPILQLSATLDETEATKSVSRSLIAARSLYHVNFLLARRQEDNISFYCTAELEFDRRVCHVAWNPHIYGEAAAILGNGAVCMFDANTSSGKLHITPTGTLRATAKMNSSYPAEERPFWQEQASRRDKLQKIRKGLNRVNFGSENVDAEWWCCDYAWHPRTLFVAGCQQVSLVDFRSNVVNSGMQVPSGASQQVIHSRSSNVASAACHGYCTQSVDRDHFLAFSRDDCHGMYNFCVASRRHILLYDVRRPKTPVLQWEHAMGKEPPRLLLMSFLSTAPSGLDISTNSGKVIFAASVQSGDIRAFCYGPQPVTQVQPVCGWKSSRKSDIDDIVCAWQLPSKVLAPLQPPDSCPVVSSLNDVSLIQEEQADFDKGSPPAHCMSGLLVLGSQGGVRNPNCSQTDFAMVHLSAEGDIIAQKYRLSERLTACGPNPVPRTPAPVSAEGNRLQCKTERMPATLNCTIWPAYESTPCEEGEDEPRSLVGKGKKRKLLESSLFPGRHIKSKQRFSIDRSKVQRCHLDMIGDQTGGSSSQVMDINDTHHIGMDLELGRTLTQLDSPLGIHEVGRKVVQMQLPPGVAQLASGMPYDSEDFIQQKPYCPTPLPILYGERQAYDPDFGVGGLLSGNEEKVLEKKYRVPLPLLLEVRQQLKGHSKGYLTVEESSQAENMANGSYVECNPVQEQGSGLMEFPRSSKTAHDFLLEAFERVGEDLDQGEVVSLAEPGESYDRTSRPRTLSYRVAPRLPNLHRPTALSDGCAPSQSDVPGNAASTAQHTSYKFDYSRFVAGCKDEDDGTHSESSSPSFDQSLCPIKLAYKGKDYQLDAYELEKLKAVETSFGRWQQAFSEYKTFTSNFGS